MITFSFPDEVGGFKILFYTDIDHMAMLERQLYIAKVPGVRKGTEVLKDGCV